MNQIMTSLIQTARAQFLSSLLRGDLSEDDQGVPSIADRGSNISKEISKGLLARIGKALTAEKTSGQTAGKSFEIAVADFLRATFIELGHLRPGSWEVLTGGKRAKVSIENFQQYHHLLRLSEKAKHDMDLRAVLGGDYLVEPDIIVVREPESDESINKPGNIVNDEVSQLTPLRSKNAGTQPLRFLHASISCKWTIRSDRAQNSRTEAMNLIRNRNGHVPHMVAITAEPMPSRISSIARGTSDLDCMYHIALPELQAAVRESMEGRRSEQDQELDMLIAGKRLRDISDLPLDLAI
jgi:hypothetical protein